MRVLKFLIALFTFTFLLFTLPVPVHAQSPIPTYVSPTSPVYTDLLVHNLFHTFSCLSVGQSVIGQPCLSYQNGMPVLSKVNLQGGVLGATTSVIAMLYLNQPVRTSEYLASVGQGLGIVKEAHAQVGGSGAGVLSPILKLWQVSRNISYVFMIIIFVVIGLMVMFRNKINPQTVITAQAALPGLVIGLILITFSYFLAGLITDMAFVGTNVVGYYFAAAQGKTNDPEIVNLVQKISLESVLSIFSRFVGIIDQGKATGALNSVWNALGDNVQAQLSILAGLLAAQFVGPMAGGVAGLAPPWGLLVGPAVSLLSGLGVATAPTFFFGFMLAFIATLALIYAMLKLLIRLISSYLTIIFLTISAPFQFLASSLPGRQGIATAWILNMLANILVFPAVLAVFYFVAFILGQSFGPLKISYLNQNQTQENIFPSAVYAQGNTNIVGNTAFPLLGGMELDFIKILLAFGALMALPAIPDIIVRSIGKVGQAGQLIGQEIGGGVRSGQGYYSQGSNALSGTTGSVKRGLFGERALHYDPATGEMHGQWSTPGFIDVARGKIHRGTPGTPIVPPPNVGSQ